MICGAFEGELKWLADSGVGGAFGGVPRVALLAREVRTARIQRSGVVEFVVW